MGMLSSSDTPTNDVGVDRWITQFGDALDSSASNNTVTLIGYRMNHWSTEEASTTEAYGFSAGPNTPCCWAVNMRVEHLKYYGHPLRCVQGSSSLPHSN
jgi:hypothetical protein